MSTKPTSRMIDADVALDIAVIRSLVARGRRDAAAMVARGMAGYLADRPPPSRPYPKAEAK